MQIKHKSRRKIKKRRVSLTREYDRGVEIVALGKSLEDYLEAILVLKKERGLVRSVDVAHYMNFSKPSVSVAMKELRGMEYVTVDQDGYLGLTEAGSEIAEQVYEKHRFFSDFLIEIGVDPVVAERDACLMEHVISEESFSKLKEKLEKHGE